MAQNFNKDLKILNEAFFSDIVKSVWASFTNIFKQLKELSVSAIKTLKLDEIGASILSLLKDIPILGRFVPDLRGNENQAKEIVGSIGIGDGISKAMNSLQFIVNKVFINIPGYQSILSMFDINSRRSWLQKWYQAMLNAEIEPKYANAYLMILSIKIPFYTVMYNWKSLWSKGIKPDESGKRTDDKLHFTQGDPNRDADTGFDETDKILSIKFQKFIQIKLTSTGDLDTKRRLSRQIIKETFTTVLTTWIIFGFSIFKQIGLDGNIIGDTLDTILRWMFLPIYCYLLFSAVVLTSLAIENEETFRPSNKNVNKDSNGTISFH